MLQHFPRSSIRKSLPLITRSSHVHIYRSSVSNRQYFVPHVLKSDSAESAPLCRRLSTTPDDHDKKKDLRESIEKLKSEDASNKTKGDQPEMDPRLERFSDAAASFIDSLSQTWKDLVSAGAPKDINKKIGMPEVSNTPNYGNDDEAADKYEEYKGSKDIMVVDPQEHLSAWERMERRLKDAPIIQGMFFYIEGWQLCCLHLIPSY